MSGSPTDLLLPELVPGALSLGVKLQGCEADNSPSSSAELKDGYAITSLPLTSSLYGV
jgi:hypothetical protein